MWIGRSWTRNRSAIAAESLDGLVVAVGDRLVGDVARGHHERAPRPRAADGGAACRGASRRGRASAARPRAPRSAPARRRAITIGRSVPRSRLSSAAVSSTSARGASRSGPSARTACPRDACARAARRRRLVVRATGEMEAAEALDRDDRPSASRLAGGVDRVPSAAIRARRRRPGERAGRRPGTRSAGRGSGGCAGPRTRRGTRGTSRKAAIVVSGRSYGTPRTIVNRGPQLVQLMNG